jgi:hypothetical protein
LFASKSPNPSLVAVLALKRSKEAAKEEKRRKKKCTSNKTSVKIKTALGAKFGFGEVH